MIINTFKSFFKYVNEDWAFILLNKFSLIPSVYKKSFLIIFLGLNFVFAFLSIHFITGNHDWPFLVNGISIRQDFWQGRFFARILDNLFLLGQVLPILSYTISFAGFSLVAISLLVYWKLPKSVFSYSLIGLLFVLQPYTLSWLYYTESMLSHLWQPLFVILSYMISEKIKALSGIIKKIFYFGLALFLLLFVLGIYPAILNTIAVVFLSRLAIDFIDWNGSKKQMWEIISLHKYTVLSIIIATFLYKGILIGMERKGMLVPSIFTESTSLKDLPLRFLQVIRSSFYEIWEYNEPFIKNRFIKGFAFLLFLSIITIATKVLSPSNKKSPPSWLKRLVKFALILFFTIMALILSKSSFILGDSLKEHIQPRLDFLGIAFFHIFIIIVLFKGNTLTKNITTVVCVFLLWTCVFQNFHAQRVWKFGYEAEKMLWNRLLNRIEIIPEFNLNKKYSLLFVGISLPSYRGNYYNEDKSGYYKLRSGELLNFSFDPYWQIMQAPEFFYEHTFIEKRYSTGFPLSPQNQKETEDLILEMASEIGKAQVWPHPSSVVIKGDILMIVMDREELERVQEFIKDKR